MSFTCIHKKFKKKSAPAKKALIATGAAVGAAVGGIAALTAAMPYGVFWFVFGRPKRSTKIPASYVGTPHYIVSRAGMKVMDSLPHEDAWISSRDCLKLHAHLYPAEQGTATKKFVIGIHGYRSYARPEYGPYIEFYRSLGYSMLLPDDRAHAPSEGDYIGFGVLDRFDCVDWAKYIVETYGEDVEILLHGVSMGGATVLSASGEADLPVQVKGIVSDCAFSSGYDALSYELKAAAHLPAERLLPAVEKILEKKAGYNLHEHTALEQVQKARVPILFVHGEKDQMVPPYMVYELYGACPSEKRLLTVGGAGHAESIALAPDEYHQAIIELFGLKKPE